MEEMLRAVALFALKSTTGIHFGVYGPAGIGIETWSSPSGLQTRGDLL